MLHLLTVAVVNPGRGVAPPGTGSWRPSCSGPHGQCSPCASGPRVQAWRAGEQPAADNAPRQARQLLSDLRRA